MVTSFPPFFSFQSLLCSLELHLRGLSPGAKWKDNFTEKKYTYVPVLVDTLSERERALGTQRETALTVVRLFRIRGFQVQATLSIESYLRGFVTPVTSQFWTRNGNGNQLPWSRSTQATTLLKIELLFWLYIPS